MNCKPKCYWCSKLSKSGVHKSCWILIKAFAVSDRYIPAIDNFQYNPEWTDYGQSYVDRAGRRVIQGKIQKAYVE